MAAVVVRSSIFRDTDQNNRVLSILNEQRATARFCDVILKVREDHIYAHSNILAAASPYFGSFLGLGADQPRAFCEKAPQVIEIQIDGVDAGNGYGDAVRHVVEYMYTCTLELNSVIISQIAEIARIMQIQRIIDYCERFLKGESGAQPPDKKLLTSSTITDFGHSRRVKKINSSTETELMMFQKSSGLSIDTLQKEMFVFSDTRLDAKPITNVSKSDTVIPDSKIASASTLDSSVTAVEPATSEAQCKPNSVTDCQNVIEKATQLDSDSLPDSQPEEKPADIIVSEESPIVLIKSEDGTLTGNVMIPFVNVPLAELSGQSLPITEMNREGNSKPKTASQNENKTLSNYQGENKPKVPATRGRKRGRPSSRGRGRRRKMREVLSDSDPELIQEPDDSEMFDLGPSMAMCISDQNTKLENDAMNSSQETPSASASATDSTVSVVSGEEVKEEEPETLTRTRGRKPITSVMASWTSPRRRAGIPRSVFRSDYVMHSLIRRSRQGGALHSPSLKGDEKALDEMETDQTDICKNVVDNSTGIESAIKFVCQTCDFTTVSFRLYRQHMKRHPETDTRSYTCSECNFHTTKARQLLQHRKKHLHEDLICSYCESQFDTNENFEAHLQRHAHALPFFCHACDMRFKTRTQLTTHLPKHCTEKPFVCQICGNGFKWKHALKSHMVTHSATKDHLCDICGFATAHKSQLKAHHLIHTGDTFKCPEPGCSFEATKRQNLKYHMVTHTQEKPHQCEVCGQAFSLIKNMRRHMLLHNDTRPYHCSVCTYTSTRYDKLKEHKLKQHGIGQPPGKKLKCGDIRQIVPGAITISEDGTVVRSGVENLQMVNMMEPITIAQDGNNITIRSDVTLTDEALQTIAQFATANTENAAEGTQPREAQINITTSEGIPVIARVQFTSAESEMVSYVAQVQE